ncbi:hypothetical protein ABPG77_005992 [Micractinium sp. CCAP 211/92]
MLDAPEAHSRTVVAEPPTPYLGREERMLLDLGKAEHRETTATARRALQVAEQTREVAHSTLVEVHRQGAQLERAELGLQEVGREVREASALLRFMRRWCCLQCCDCCDPTVEQDRTRRQRVLAAKRELAMHGQLAEQRRDAKQEGVARRARQHDPAFSGDEKGGRQELFARADTIRAERHGPRSTDIGAGLPEEDRQEIQQETQQQDALLDQIGDAVQELHAMSKELHTGLAEQQPVVERLTGATAVTHDQLGKLAQEARRI